MNIEALQEALSKTQYKPLVKLQKHTELPEQIYQLHQMIFGDDKRIYFDLSGVQKVIKMVRVSGKRKDRFSGEMIDVMKKKRVLADEPEETAEQATPAFEIDKIIKGVGEHLAKKGYAVHDINKNMAYKFIDLSTDKGKMAWSKIPEANKSSEAFYEVKGHIVLAKKNEFSITKLLNDNPVLKTEYESYYQKVQSKQNETGETEDVKEDDCLIVLSRDAYDIGGASTGRYWRSCMQLDNGVNRHYIAEDVKGGNLVAYLIKKDDLNIEHPYARVMVKKYKSKTTDKVIFFPEQSCYYSAYFQAIDKFIEVMQKIFVRLQRDVMTKEEAYDFINNDVIKQYRDKATKGHFYINPEGGMGLIDKDEKVINDKLKETISKANDYVREKLYNDKDALGKLKSHDDIINNERIMNEIKEDVINNLEDNTTHADSYGDLMIHLLRLGMPHAKSAREPLVKEFIKNNLSIKDKITFSLPNIDKVEKKDRNKNYYGSIDPDNYEVENSMSVKFSKEDFSHYNANYADEITDYIEDIERSGGNGVHLRGAKVGKDTLSVDVAVSPILKWKVNSYEQFADFLKTKFPDFKLNKIYNSRMLENGYARLPNMRFRYPDIHNAIQDTLDYGIIPNLKNDDENTENFFDKLFPFVEKQINDRVYSVEQFLGKDKIPFHKVYLDWMDSMETKKKVSSREPIRESYENIVYKIKLLKRAMV